MGICESSTAVSTDASSQVDSSTLDESTTEALFSWEKDPAVRQRLDFDVWYDIIKAVTMRSELQTVGVGEIRAIVAKYEAQLPQNEGMTLSEEQSSNLAKFKLRFADFIAEMEATDCGMFVRFSKRSPKDAILRMNSALLKQRVQETAASLMRESMKIKTEFGTEQMAVNSVLRALTLETSKLLCVRSAEDALELVTKSHRLFSDFTLGELMEGDSFESRLILREFNHQIDFESEFRCFVFRSRLTAISQYNSLVYVPRIAQMAKAKVVECISDYWRREVQPLMQAKDIGSYVLDVAMLRDDDTDDAVVASETSDEQIDEEKVDCETSGDCTKLIVIECNPFCKKAGALLFDWQNADDVRILTREDSSDTAVPVLRICEAPASKRPPKLTKELHSLFDDTCALLIEEHSSL